MAKKSLKKATKQLAPEGRAKRSDRAYPAQPQELNDQPQRLKNVAAVEAEAAKAPARLATPELSPATAAISQPPLTPLAALWPKPPASPGGSTPSQMPTRQVQTTPVKGAAPQTSSAPAATPRIKVTFILPICDAKRVALSGEFNGWSPDASPMKQHPDGHWETTVDLAPGRYEYKFVRDGEWIPDLLAHQNVWNQHGTLNSVVEVRA
jgi:hypothetical protein